MLWLPRAIRIYSSNALCKPQLICFWFWLSIKLTSATQIWFNGFARLVVCYILTDFSKLFPAPRMITSLLSISMRTLKLNSIVENRTVNPWSKESLYLLTSLSNSCLSIHLYFRPLVDDVSRTCPSLYVFTAVTLHFLMHLCSLCICLPFLNLTSSIK